MGVYSKVVLESTVPEVEPVKQETAPTPTADPNPVGESVDPIQFVIDTHQNDLALFEAVIETDFAEAYNEAGLCSLTESDLTAMHEAVLAGIKEKFQKAIDAFLAAFNNLMAKVMVKIQDIIKADEKLKEKCKAIRDNSSKIASCTSTTDTIDYDAVGNATSSIFELITKAKNIDVTGGSAIADASAIKEATDKFKAEFKMESLWKKAKDEKDTVGVRLGNDLNKLLGDVEGQYKSSIKYIEDGKKAALEIAKNGKKAANAQLKASETEESASAAQAAYDAFTSLASAVSFLGKAYTSICIQVIAKERALVAILYKFVSSANSGEDNVEKVSGEVVDADGKPVGESAYAGLFEWLVMDAAEQSAVLV